MAKYTFELKKCYLIGNIGGKYKKSAEKIWDDAKAGNVYNMLGNGGLFRYYMYKQYN